MCTKIVTYFALFQLFSTKNAENEECAAPECWSKFTTAGIDNNISLCSWVDLIALKHIIALNRTKAFLGFEIWEIVSSILPYYLVLHLLTYSCCLDGLSNDSVIFLFSLRPKMQLKQIL